MRLPNTAPANAQQLNIDEFRAEWVTLLGKSDRLRKISVSFHSPYAPINSAVREILKAHGADIAASEADANIYLDFDRDSCVFLPDRGKIVFITTGENDTEPAFPTAASVMHLKTEPIYGAGLPDNCGIRSGDLSRALHVTDLFALVIDSVADHRAGTYTVAETGGDICYAPIIDRGVSINALRILEEHPTRRFYDDTTYGGNLRRLQKLQLLCLLELDRVCRENDIDYFLGGGTLLGAVRHCGFIPWDDDIDVMMTRENFDKLEAIAPQALGEDFFYQSSRTDPHYHSPFTKIRLKNTQFVTPFSSRFPEMHNEVFIDIFAHDSAPNKKFLLSAHIFATKLARSMVFHKWDGTPLHFYGRLKGICRVMTAYMKHTTIEKLERFERRIMTFFNSPSARYLYDGMGEHTGHGRFKASVLDEKIYLSFEGYDFPVPRDYDAYLRFSYGDDYSEWPRPHARVSHHETVLLSLGSENNENI